MSAKKTFQCEIQLLIPLRRKGETTEEPLYITTAKLNYDPGLKENDEVRFLYATLFDNEPMDAVVVKRLHCILMSSSENNVNNYQVRILIETSNRNLILKVADRMRKENPGEFEDNNLPHNES